MASGSSEAGKGAEGVSSGVAFSSGEVSCERPLSASWSAFSKIEVYQMSFIKVGLSSLKSRKIIRQDFLKGKI